MNVKAKDLKAGDAIVWCGIGQTVTKVEIVSKGRQVRISYGSYSSVTLYKDEVMEVTNRMETRSRFDAIRRGQYVKWNGINFKVVGVEHKTGIRMSLLIGEADNPIRLEGTNSSTVTSYI